MEKFHLNNAKRVVRPGLETAGDKVLESRIRVDKVADLLKRTLAAGHHEADPGIVAVELQAGLVRVQPHPAREKLVRHKQALEGQLDLLGRHFGRVLRARREEMDRLDVEVKHLVDVRQEHRLPLARRRADYQRAAVARHPQVVDLTRLFHASHAGLFTCLLDCQGNFRFGFNWGFGVSRQ